MIGSYALRCLAVAAAMLAATTTATAQSAACDRTCLRELVDGYFAALEAHDPQRLPATADVKFTENGRVLALGEGFWKTAGAPLPYRDYLLDPDSGGAAALSALREYTGV